MRKSLTLEIAVVNLHRVICCLNICRDDVSHICGRDHDVYLLPSVVTDVMSAANIFSFNIKIIPVTFLSTNKN